MSTRSNNQGRAYEYVWMEVLHDAVYNQRKTEIVHNSSLEANKRAWSTISNEMRDMFKVSANSAVEQILELEPQIAEDDGDILTLEFQRDSSGMDGDVRDIVIKRDNIKWEVGLSIKHNHDAIKHSRLSSSIDFGKKWFDVNCSDTYWTKVMPIFDRLRKESQKGTKWAEIENKEDSVYVPLLQAFIDEILFAYQKDKSIPRKMIEYLIGKKDYYKIISNDRRQITFIHTFNIQGTLGKPSKIKTSAYCVPVIDLPTEIVLLRFKPNSKTTVEMYLNNGWQLSFRIHNADSRVKSSLKFDIQFVGTPVSILEIECNWE